MPDQPTAWTARLPGPVRSLAEGRLVRRAMVVVSGTAIFQVVLLASTPFLSRLYTPEDFGVLSVFSSLVTLTLVAASLRYEQAIALPHERERAVAVTAVAALALLGTTVVFSALLLLIGRPLAEASDTPGLWRAMWLFPAAFFGAGLQQLLTYVAVRRAAFRTLATSRAGQGIAMVGTQLALGVAVGGANALVGGFALGLLVAAVMLMWSDRHEIGLARRSVRRDAMRVEAQRYRRFPGFGVWSGLFNRGALDLPNLAFAAIFGPAISGLFLLSQRIVAAPTQLLGQSVGHVYFNEAAVTARTAPDRLPHLYRQVSRRMGSIGLAISVPMVLLSPWAFALVFGEEWREAGEFTAVLAPAFLAQITITPLTSTFAIAERQDLQFVRDAIRLAGVVGVFLAAWQLGWSALWTVAGYSAVMVAGYLLLWYFGWREVVRYASEAAPRRPDRQDVQP